MKTKSMIFGTSAFVFVTMALLTGSAIGAEIRVMISGGFRAAYLELVPNFERATGHKIVSVRGASMGTGPNSIRSRLQRGEPVDVFVMIGDELEDLTRQGMVAVGTRTDLARSSIGVAVRAGSPKPDIGSVDAFRRAMLDAKSIGYSSRVSGIYLSTELFPKLGIADQVKAKMRLIVGGPVGAAVARGEVEIGLQQISELLPVPGLDFVGPLPAEIQKITVFSAGVAAGAKEPEAARALINFLAAPAASGAISKSGMEPIAR